MNRDNPGSTLADEMRYQDMKVESKAIKLERLNKELASCQNPERIAGLKTLIASIEARRAVAA